MRAEAEIECNEPQKIIEAIRPDMEKSEKFSVSLEAEGDKLKVKVESQDVTGLMAGFNSYMRLIRTAMEVQKID